MEQRRCRSLCVLHACFLRLIRPTGNRTWGNRATIAIDTNAYVAFKRADLPIVTVIQHAPSILVSVTVLGELLGGFASGNREGKLYSITKHFKNNTNLIANYAGWTGVRSCFCEKNFDRSAVIGYRRQIPNIRTSKRGKEDKSQGVKRVRTKRKPLPKLRMTGVFPTRMAERRNLGLLPQLPPRSTRNVSSPTVHACPSQGAPT